MSLPYPRIHVVINPASGKNQPILNTLNDVFHAAGVDWDVSITHKSGDAARQARAAAASLAWRAASPDWWVMLTSHFTPAVWNTSLRVLRMGWFFPEAGLITTWMRG